jgi:AcrR family transcriptional regulator
VTETTERPTSRSDRHLAARRDIVRASWALARERGLVGWALRDVAGAVGMRAPSLYVYFDSKHALYDAMFAEGNAELLRRVQAAVTDVETRELGAREILRTGARLFFDFCVEDPARYELLFLRTIPGFVPSEASYALARSTLDQLTAVLTAAGAGAPEQVDLWTALISGLVAQQVSNDPQGDRWSRLVDPAIDMFVAAQLPPSPQDGHR